MGMNAFLSMPGIKGSARQKHVLDKIEVHGVTAEANAPIDFKTGRPEKGKIKHQPLVVTKQIDRASPLLYEALKNKTKYDVVTLEFWRMPPGGGAEQNHYTKVMNGVQVVGVKLLMPNNRRPENEILPEQEELSLSYTSIGYSFRAGGATGGTDPKENAETSPLEAEPDKPYEAKVQELATDLGKIAGKHIAAEVYDAFKSLIKPQEPKK